MERIDRLGWTAGASFRAYGVRVGVRANDSAVLELLRPHFPPGWAPSFSRLVDRLYSVRTGGPITRPGLKRFNLLYSGALRIARTLDIEELLAAFESDVDLEVAERARGRLFVHAGVVLWGKHALLIP